VRPDQGKAWGRSGWGAAVDVGPWLQSVLVDLAAVVEECSDVRVPCRAGILPGTSNPDHPVPLPFCSVFQTIQWSSLPPRSLIPRSWGSSPRSGDSSPRSLCQRHNQMSWAPPCGWYPGDQQNPHAVTPLLFHHCEARRQ
jgi:hypothetical protein